MILGKQDRKISLIDRGDSVVIIDARSGTQEVHRMPKRNAKRLLAVTAADTIVVDVATLAVSIEPKAIVTREPASKPPREKPAAEKPAGPPKTRRVCKHLGPAIPDEVFPPREGLGDLLSDGLSAIGITKERWSALVNQGKAEGVCTGCDGRQTFVNWLGSKLGLSEGQGPALHKLLASTEIPQQPVHGCAIHGKCLPRMRGDDELREASKGAGFTWCHGCGDRAWVQVEGS